VSRGRVEDDAQFIHDIDEAGFGPTKRAQVLPLLWKRRPIVCGRIITRQLRIRVSDTMCTSHEDEARSCTSVVLPRIQRLEYAPLLGNHPSRPPME